ncbi:hypothetical protein LCGC14_1578430 [marine sediment metagenome]|uniref:Uncharacterized protein n=1 Tax=marine sediment metagenome TaxID=412755 RepID=A0A0F9IHM4_9ZZZZ
MNCPKCNEKIDHRGIVYHFQVSHNYYYPEMISILFDKVDELERTITILKKTMCKSPTMSLDLFDEENNGPE